MRNLDWLLSLDEVGGGPLSLFNAGNGGGDRSSKFLQFVNKFVTIELEILD